MSLPVKAAVVVFLSLGLAACEAGHESGAESKKGEPRFSGLELIHDSALRASVRTYYAEESRQDWKGAYSYRSANFHSLVPLSTYAREMSNGAAGRELFRLVVESSACSADICKLRITFCETSDLQHAGLLSTITGGRMCYHEPSVMWRLVGSRWVGLDVGDRTHFPLNDNMADN